MIFCEASGRKRLDWPNCSQERLKEFGYGIVIFPISTLLTTAKAIRAALAEIKTE